MKLLIVQCSSHVTILRRVEGTKGAISIRISKNRQQNGQKKNVQKDKQPSTKHTYKAKVRVTRIPLKTGVNSGAPEGPANPASLVVPVVLM
jgi:hypothetical protein